MDNNFVHNLFQFCLYTYTYIKIYPRLFDNQLLVNDDTPYCTVQLSTVQFSRVQYDAVPQAQQGGIRFLHQDLIQFSYINCRSTVLNSALGCIETFSSKHCIVHNVDTLGYTTHILCVSLLADPAMPGAALQRLSQLIN